MIWVIFSVFWLIVISYLLTDMVVNDRNAITAYLSRPFGDWVLDRPILVIVIYLIVVFLLMVYFWHKFLFAFPVFMSFFSRILRHGWSPKAFPKIIDYGYYTVAALVLFNIVLAVDGTIVLSSVVIQIEIAVALVFLSLKFTKVSLELNPQKYIEVGHVMVRTFAGRTVFPIRISDR